MYIYTRLHIIMYLYIHTHTNIYTYIYINRYNSLFSNTQLSFSLGLGMTFPSLKRRPWAKSWVWRYETNSHWELSLALKMAGGCENFCLQVSNVPTNWV
jgi:hypothetical protein